MPDIRMRSMKRSAGKYGFYLESSDASSDAYSRYARHPPELGSDIFQLKGELAEFLQANVHLR
jgi:hypothetical protein